MRAELGMVSYQTNILGTRGPRKMSALIPALQDEQQRCLLQPRDSNDGLLERCDLALLLPNAAHDRQRSNFMLHHHKLMQLNLHHASVSTLQ